MKSYRKLLVGFTVIGMITVLMLLGCDNPFDSDSSSSGISVPGASAPGTPASTSDFGDFSPDVTAVSDPTEAEDFLDELLGEALGGLGGLSTGSVATTGLRAQSDTGDEDEGDFFELFADFLVIEEGDGSFSARSTEDSFTFDLADLAEPGMTGTIDVTNFNVNVSQRDTQESFSASIRTALRAVMNDIDLEDFQIPKGVISMAANAELNVTDSDQTDAVSVSYAVSIDGTAALTMEVPAETTDGTPQGAHLFFTVSAADTFSASGTSAEVEAALEARLETASITASVSVYGANADEPLATRDLTENLATLFD